MKYLTACSAAAAFLLLLGSCKKENSAAAPELALAGGILYEDTMKTSPGAELLIPFELSGGPAQRLSMCPSTSTDSCRLGPTPGSTATTLRCCPMPQMSWSN